MFLFGKKPSATTLSMSKAAEELAADKAIFLLDVRTEAEFRAGHIPGSVNLPLDRLAQIAQMVPDLDRRLFVYCQSGGRSRAACSKLAKLGYTNITNIGGILSWTGPIERGA